MAGFDHHPDKPYYAVIFSSKRTEKDDEGYIEMAEAMVALAQKQPGFIGLEDARGSDRIGVTVSYWESEEAIKNWKQVVSHLAAQKLGREKWYEWYNLRVAKVERGYSYEK